MTDPRWLLRWNSLLAAARAERDRQTHIADYDHPQEVPLSVMEAVDAALRVADTKPLGKRKH